MKKEGIFILSFLCVLSLAGQGKWSPLDSTRRALTGCKPGFRIGLDGRNSFLNGHAVRVAGLRLGLDYGKVSLYTGAYTTSLSIKGDLDTVNVGFNYFSSTFEYSLYKTWRFQVVTALQVGLGTTYDYRKSGTEVTRNFQGMVVPLEMGISGTVRFLRYFGWSMGTGIRVSPINGNGFNGAFYSFGLTFFTGTLYRDCKKAWNKRGT